MATEAPEETDRATVRAKVFTHLAGVVMGPTISALSERGVLNLLESMPAPVPFDYLVQHAHANAGYLRVALRLLASCGWLIEAPSDGAQTYALTSGGRVALPLAAPRYRHVTASFLPKALLLDDFLLRPADEGFMASLADLVALAQSGWGIASPPDSTVAEIHGRIRGHLEGMLVAPAMVALARGGFFAQL